MDLFEVIYIIGDIAQLAVSVVFALALLYFFWNTAHFILSANDEEKRKKAKSGLAWGLIALFVLITAWGIIEVIQETFFFGSSSEIIIPTELPR